MKAFKGVDWSTYVRAKNQEMKDNGNGNSLLNASNDIPTEVDFEIEDEDLKVDIQDYRATNSEVPVKIKFVNQTTDVVEVFCYDKDGKKVSRGKIEPSIEVSSYDTFETHNWCCEGPGFYSLNGEQIFTAKKEEE